MLRKRFKGILAGICALVLPLSAHAVTVSDQGVRLIEFGSGEISSTFVAPDSFLTEWTGATGSGNTVRAYQRFSVSDVDQFKIGLTEYSGLAGEESKVVLFSGLQNGGGSNSPFFLQETRIDNSNIGSVFGSLLPGDYTLFFSQFGPAPNGSASFQISAVPLPAGIFLMLGALGGLVLLRKDSSSSSLA